MKKKRIRKSEKWNKGRKFSKLRDYKFENKQDTAKIDKFAYQNYERNKTDNKRAVSIKRQPFCMWCVYVKRILDNNRE